MLENIWTLEHKIFTFLKESMENQWRKFMWSLVSFSMFLFLHIELREKPISFLWDLPFLQPSKFILTWLWILNEREPSSDCQLPETPPEPEATHTERQETAGRRWEMRLKWGAGLQSKQWKWGPEERKNCKLRTDTRNDSPVPSWQTSVSQTWFCQSLCPSEEGESSC